MQLSIIHSHSPYQCPLCAEPLQLNDTAKSYACQNKHSFDIAKEGYLNLLPVHFKHSKEPGDNKEMITARRLFLESGFYNPLAKAIALMIDYIHNPGTDTTFLDLGCGEGYYARQIELYCKTTKNLSIHGNDISKTAVSAAAKKQRSAQFIVASSTRLPYLDNFFDIVMRIFAPSDTHELKRIIKPSGYLLTATPGPRHLWQLKEQIYSDAKEHTHESEVPEDFELFSSQRVSYKIAPTIEQRMALLEMTPLTWSANEKTKKTLSGYSELEIEIDFILNLYINSK